MKRTERLATALAPDGSELALLRHDRDYILRVNGADLMSTRRHASEDELARVACAPLGSTPRAAVLIGGLGLGFTLRTALALLASDARVVVAEIVEAVIGWNRNPDYAISVETLADPRVELHHADVADMIGEGADTFDAIMLDVDNGAEALTTAGNVRLYGDDGILRTVAALRPHGRIVYWSAQPDRAFERALRRAGLAVESVPVRAHADRGAHHTLLVAGRG